MDQNGWQETKLALQHVAPHTVTISHMQCTNEPNTQENTCFDTTSIQMQTSGKGHVESYEIFPGLAVLFYQFLAQQVHVVHPPAPFLLQIDYCDQGRVGWDMQNGDAVYLGTGDVCIHNLHHCANATMRFPLGFYRGVAILADLKALQINSPDIFQQTGFDPTALQKRFCKDNQACSILSCADTQHLFAPLCNAPHTQRSAYARLKAVETLLYLSRLSPEQTRSMSQYGAQKVALIREIHDFLIANPAQRFTIETLSKKYLINTSSLKTMFKAVYGMPLAAYLKEYRMKCAMRLLANGDASIADVAAAVGYETQGKFTKAFKAYAGTLPSEFRRQSRHFSDVEQV